MENLPTFVLHSTKKRSIWRFLLPAGCVSSCSQWEPLQQLWAGAPSQLWPHLPPHTCGFCCLKGVLISSCPAVCPHLGAAAPVARPGFLQVPDLTWASSPGAKGMLVTPEMSLGPEGLSMADGPMHLGPSMCHEGLQPSRTEMESTAVEGLHCSIWTAGSIHGPFALSFPPSFN